MIEQSAREELRQVRAAFARAYGPDWARRMLAAQEADRPDWQVMTLHPEGDRPPLVLLCRGGFAGERLDGEGATW